MKLFYQFSKFIIVGGVNTVITLLAIYFFYSYLTFNYTLANALGFLLGFINSFLLNKFWTFHSNGRHLFEAVLFCFVFIVSYLVQLAIFMGMRKLAGADILISQMFSMIGYTIINFLGNRCFTFRKKMSVSVEEKSV